MARAKALIAHDPLRRWTAADANDTYNIPRWGCGYFGVNDQGNLIVTPRPNGDPTSPPAPGVVHLDAPGAIDMKELIDELVARGVTVSAGHTDATAAEAHLAFDRGVRTVTHLFNAMRHSTARDPSIAMSALARPDVIVQVIVDLHHVAPDTVLVAWHSAAGRFALVTDAAPAAGMGDGEFVLGGRKVHAADGVVRGPEGQLAGSALTMIEGVRNLMSLGVSLQDALRAASQVPARVAQRPDLGRLAPGSPADVVVLDDRVDVIRVLVDGRERVART